VPWGSLKAQEPRSATAAPQCARPGNINVVVDDRKRAALIKLMNQMVEKKIAPGVVMMVEQRGRPVIAIKTGFADAEAKAPMREDTLFRVYSMTKPLTSVAAMQLIEAGRLSLADPVSKYIPEFRTTRVAATDGKLEALARPITVRDLMTHTAGMTYASAATDPVHSAYRKLGIPAGPGVDTLPADGSAPVRTTEELARRLALAPVLNQPGSRFTYGNASDVLGRVVEVAGGVRLRDVIAARITGPLGMSDSAFAVKPGDVARLSAAYVSPSQQAGKSEATLQTIDVATLGNGRLMRVDGGNTSIYLRASEIDYGGAGMISSAPDYLRFTQMLRQRGSLEGKRVLQAPSVDAMRLDQLAPEARSGSPMLGGLGFGYGFAVRLAPTADTPVFPRCGYFWGGAASTYFWVDPAGQTSGVMMTQVFGGDVRPYWLAAMRIIYAP
jgi:CubicO group peptidase (beta-lactamase class C family)